MNEKKKRIYYILGGLIFYIAISIFFSISGHQLAQAEVNQEERRLIGVFITTDPLDLPYEFAGPFTVSFWNRVDYNALFTPGRLYANWCEESSMFYFPDIEGIPFFVAYVPQTEGQNGGIHSAHFGSGIRSHGFHIHFGDNLTHIDIEGTIYVIPGSQAHARVVINNVYQTADGTIYLENSHGGFSFHGVTSEGSVMSQTLQEDIVINQNGTETIYSIAVKINHATLFPPTEIIVLEMDVNSQLVNRVVLEPGANLDVFYTHENTHYMIVEVVRTIPEGVYGQPIIREIVGFGDFAIPVFDVQENGIISRGGIQIEWD